MVLRVTTWNVEWAPFGAGRSGAGGLLAAQRPDVAVVTELGSPEVLPPGGHRADGGGDWGYAPRHASSRKVVLWSRTPWDDVTWFDELGFPAGRCVSGVTTTRLGPVRVVGVCIPWSAAHVSSGRRDRRPWEDHLSFLAALADLPAALFAMPVILAGDFNQRIPRRRQPAGVFDALTAALDGRFQVVAAGHEVEGRPLIDHVAVTGDLRVADVSAFDGRRWSDHDGVNVDLGVVHPRR